MAWRKNFTKIVTSRWGGRFSTPCLDGVDCAQPQTGKQYFRVERAVSGLQNFIKAIKTLMFLTLFHAFKPYCVKPLY